jgi:seryl-tRNA synthetase
MAPKLLVFSTGLARLGETLATAVTQRQEMEKTNTALKDKRAAIQSQIFFLVTIGSEQAEAIKETMEKTEEVAKNLADYENAAALERYSLFLAILDSVSQSLRNRVWFSSIFAVGSSFWHPYSLRNR